jgi:hypothetical protein
MKDYTIQDAEKAMEHLLNVIEHLVRKDFAEEGKEPTLEQLQGRIEDNLGHFYDVASEARGFQSSKWL